MFEVLAGTVSVDRKAADAYQLIRVQKIYLNPNSKKLNNGQIDWDMALLYLSVPLEYGDYVQPICLHNKDGPDVIGSTCYLAGWGFINDQKGRYFVMNYNISYTSIFWPYISFQCKGDCILKQNLFVRNF